MFGKRSRCGLCVWTRVSVHGGVGESYIRVSSILHSVSLKSHLSCCEGLPGWAGNSGRHFKGKFQIKDDSCSTNSICDMWSITTENNMFVKTNKNDIYSTLMHLKLKCLGKGTALEIKANTAKKNKKNPVEFFFFFFYLKTKSEQDILWSIIQFFYLLYLKWIQFLF